MRACIEKSTGKLIESQSGGETQEHLDTLLKNAVNAGYKPEDIEAKFISDAEFAEIMEKMKPIPTYADLRRAAYPPEREILVALWEREVEGRPESSEVLQAKRIEVKAKYPKT